MEKTLDVAQNTISLLENQTQKINNIENKVNNIDDTLSYSEYLVNKMSSILFNIFNKNIIFNGFLDKSNQSLDKSNESLDKDLTDQSLDKDESIINDLENLKNLNLLIGDKLDLHNDKLTHLHDKMEITEIKTEKLNKSIKKLTY
jgi:hypothetical protein